MTTCEFGRLVNRVSADHACKNVMRWGFLMNALGFDFEKSQADAIRRFCLGKGQKTEWDERLTTLYGSAPVSQFNRWYKYWFDPNAQEVVHWLQMAFSFLIAFENSLDDNMPDSFRPTMFLDNTFEHIIQACKATFVLINPKIEGGRFSIQDWEAQVLQELKSRPKVRWQVMREFVMDEMNAGVWSVRSSPGGYFGAEEQFTRELFQALVGEGSLLYELMRTVLGNLGSPDANLQSYLKGIRTDRGRYVDAFVQVGRMESFSGRSNRGTYEWVPVAYDVQFASDDRLVQGPNVASSDMVAGWESLQEGNAQHRQEVGQLFIFGDANTSRTDQVLYELRTNGNAASTQSITDASQWPWSGERNFRKYQISETHFERIRDLVLAARTVSVNPAGNKRLEPPEATDPSDRKRRAHEQRTDPEEEIPAAKRQRFEKAEVLGASPDVVVEADVADAGQRPRTAMMVVGTFVVLAVAGLLVKRGF